MVKRNKEFMEESESVESAQISDVETPVEAVESEKNSMSIEDMTDEELLKFMESRKRVKEESVAIKPVNLPSYILARYKVKPVITESSNLQDQINRLNYEIRKKG